MPFSLQIVSLTKSKQRTNRRMRICRACCCWLCFATCVTSSIKVRLGHHIHLFALAAGAYCSNWFCHTLRQIAAGHFSDIIIALHDTEALRRCWRWWRNLFLWSASLANCRLCCWNETTVARLAALDILSWHSRNTSHHQLFPFSVSVSVRDAQQCEVKHVCVYDNAVITLHVSVKPNALHWLPSGKKLNC